jgi:2-oxoglutarate ferredoxin oxidoreductase subunit delta
LGVIVALAGDVFLFGQKRRMLPMEFWRTPLDADAIDLAKGSVHILEERCKGCGYCIEFCPRAILAFSKRFNKKGYHPPELLKADGCVNCHYCEIICPEFAIYSVFSDAA